MSKIKKGDQKLKIISEEQFTKAEIQIREKEKLVDYRITEYPIDVLVEKYWNGIEDDANEIFVPEYQRDFVWDEKRNSLAHGNERFATVGRDITLEDLRRYYEDVSRYLHHFLQDIHKFLQTKSYLDPNFIRS
jgi:hypothetical protein